MTNGMGNHHADHDQSGEHGENDVKQKPRVERQQPAEAEAEGSAKPQKA